MMITLDEGKCQAEVLAIYCTLKHDSLWIEADMADVTRVGNSL
jgi:hypothetical protein